MRTRSSRLALVKREPAAEQYRLHVARANLHAAQKRIMERLYSLYVNGKPSTLDVLAGAQSLSQVIDRAEAAQVLSNQDAALGRRRSPSSTSSRRASSNLTKLRAKRAQHRAQARLAEAADRSRRSRSRSGCSRRSTRRSTQLQVQEAARERRPGRGRGAAARRDRGAQGGRAGRRGAGAQRRRPTTLPAASRRSAAAGAGHPQAASIALQYLGVPYVWGGASPSGFDCSGLVMYVYAQLGISLPHYTVSQWNVTQPISSPAPGDLVFFNGLGHVGIYLGGGQIVDAPHTGSVVRIDSISGFGATTAPAASRSALSELLADDLAHL